MSSVSNVIARIQCLEAYTRELEGQRQIFRFLGRWVDEADQLVSLLRFSFVEIPFHWDKHVASLKVELVRYDVWQLRQSSSFRLNASMSRSGRARQNPYSRWDGIWFPFTVADMSRRYETCGYSQEQKDVWGDSITLVRLYELIALRFPRRFRLWCPMHREKFLWVTLWQRSRFVLFYLCFHVIHFTLSFYLM